MEEKETNAELKQMHHQEGNKNTDFNSSLCIFQRETILLDLFSKKKQNNITRSRDS